ncbi:MAG: RNA-directed DNA polymerase [Bacteriovoracaceae bacterium]
MLLNKNSIKWAIKHINSYSDTDLFPHPEEFIALEEMSSDLIPFLETLNLGSHKISTMRQFMVSKGDTFFRKATQLAPIDNIILAALIHQFGKQIEEQRFPIEDNVVFSNRFKPSAKGSLYAFNDPWNSYWSESLQRATHFKKVIVGDFSDFYNQIYHHTLENILIRCNFPNQGIKFILNLCNKSTANISRGIPIGPHATHMLAEASLIEFDEALKSKGMEHKRFVDDFIVFCTDDMDVRLKLQQIATTVDKQQKLTLNQSKTHSLTLEEFEKIATENQDGQPKTKEEEELLLELKSLPTNCAYRMHIARRRKLSKENLIKFPLSKVNTAFQAYLLDKNVNYSRIKWLIRRFTASRVPSAVQFLIQNFNDLIPCISDICNYFITVGTLYSDNVTSLGEEFVKILDHPVIKSNSYYGLAILSMFPKRPELNHFDILSQNFNSYPAELKREIILLAYKNNNIAWIREQKERFDSMSYWEKSAMIMACSCFSKDEKKFYLNSLNPVDEMQKILIKWAKNKQ